MRAMNFPVENGAGRLFLDSDQNDQADNRDRNGGQSSNGHPSILLTEGGNADQSAEHDQDESRARPVKSLHGALGKVGVVLYHCKAENKRDHTHGNANPHDDAPCIGSTDYRHEDAADSGSKDDHPAGKHHVNSEAQAHLLGGKLHHNVRHNDRGDTRRCLCLP